MNHTDIAAHVDHGVAHTSSVARISLGLAGAVIAVACVASGAGVLVAIGTVSLGGSLGMDAGELIDKYFLSKTINERIIDGIPTVLLGPLGKKAARAHPTTKLDRHTHVAEGSKIVMLGAEFAPMSRRQDRTKCDGVIAEGIKSIIVGGEPSAKGQSFDEPDSMAVKAMSFLFGIGGGLGSFGKGEVLAGTGAIIGTGLDAMGQKDLASLTKFGTNWKPPLSGNLAEKVDYLSGLNKAGGAAYNGANLASGMVTGP